MAEKNLDFDTVHNRRGTDSLKYDFAAARGYKEDVLPLWVADMDFKTSSYIQDALQLQVEHGIYGYTETAKDYYDAVADSLDLLKNVSRENDRVLPAKSPDQVADLYDLLRVETDRGLIEKYDRRIMQERSENVA